MPITRLNVQGEITAVFTATLTYIKTSKLAEYAYTPENFVYDDEGYLIIDNITLPVFDGIVDYIMANRAWEPTQDVELITDKIIEWGLDKGLISPYLMLD